MDLELTDSQTRVRDLVRRFATERLDQAGVETDRTHRFPAEIVKELSEFGIMGIFVPETYGGAGMDHVSYALAIEEISVQCAATGVIVSAHSSLGMWPILGLGTEEQKQRFLPAMAAGEHIGCFALTEPQAGSDAAGQKTRAVLDGDSYVINGTKNFITNGPQAVGCDRFCDDRPGRRPSRDQRLYRRYDQPRMAGGAQRRQDGYPRRP